MLAQQQRSGESMRRDRNWLAQKILTACSRLLVGVLLLTVWVWSWA